LDVSVSATVDTYLLFVYMHVRPAQLAELVPIVINSLWYTTT